MLGKITSLLFITILLMTSNTCPGHSTLADDMQTGYVDLGKCKLHYEMKGKGTPLIMIHAGMLNKEIWEPQFNAFAKKFKVII